MNVSLAVPAGSTHTPVFERCAKVYVRNSKRIWGRLPAFVRSLPGAAAYGNHLHALVQRYADRNQNHSTFFLRNRPELELMVQLLRDKAQGATVNMTVVACSKGAEVYSIAWKIRKARPDLKIKIHAVDISQEVVTFGEAGIYSFDSVMAVEKSEGHPAAGARDLTWRDQVWGNTALSMFERMTDEEVRDMFEIQGNEARVRAWIKEGIEWLRGDATDPQFAAMLGSQDVVVANRFLCHMKPADADACLRNVAHLVKSGGYLFVSGVDLDVRTKVARDLGWRPVPDLMREVHEGDPSLIMAWPLEYWGIEPFSSRRPDWRVRFASAFQMA
jgi:chemotaxis methyl-accepting protein methylase